MQVSELGLVCDRSAGERFCLSETSRMPQRRNSGHCSVVSGVDFLRSSKLTERLVVPTLVEEEPAAFMPQIGISRPSREHGADHLVGLVVSLQPAQGLRYLSGPRRISRVNLRRPAELG